MSRYHFDRYQDEQDRKEERRGQQTKRSFGRMSINEWLHEIHEDGATGEFSITTDGVPGPKGHQVLLFAYLLPADADTVADLFGSGLAMAVRNGHLTWDKPQTHPPAEREAPDSNTGLSTPPSTN